MPYKYLSLSAGWLKEKTNTTNNQLGDKLNRDDVYAQLYLNLPIYNLLDLGFGFGPAYFFESSGNHDGFISSLNLQLEVSDFISTSIGWDRTLTDKHLDTDIFNAGVSFRF